MSTYYLDPESGSDSNNGSSWALAWKTFTSGATASRIAPGDTIRIAKSPDPTSVGTAKWTNTENLTGGLVSGVNINGATNATPIVISTMSAHNNVTGDIVYIYNVGGNTAANGLWMITYVDSTHYSLDGSVGNSAYTSGGAQQRINSSCVVLDSSVTKRIEDCIRADNWTADAQVTKSTTNSYNKSNYLSLQLACSGSCTTARQLAIAALPSSLDLSGYQQISLSIRNQNAISAGDLQIRLYDDTACTSLRETFNIPAMPGTTRFASFTINKGSALYSDIKGIAIYATTSMASKTFQFQNIIACKAASSADSLSLVSLIGKSSSGTNLEYYPIAGIYDRIVLLGGRLAASAMMSTTRGYCGATESVTTYKRESTKTELASSISSVVNQIMDYGTEGNEIIFEAGYNTATSLVDGLTLLDGNTGYGYGIRNTQYFTVFKNLCLIRYYNGFRPESYKITLEQCSFIQNEYGYYNWFGTQHVMTNIMSIFDAYGFSLSYLAGGLLTNIICCGNTYNGTQASQCVNNVFTDISVINAGQYAMTVNYSSGLYFRNAEFSRSAVASISASFISELFFKDSLFDDNSEILYSQYTDCKAYSHNHDQTEGYHRIITDNGYIYSEESTRPGGSGSQWVLAVTGSIRTINYPLRITIAKIACAADAEVTVKAWIKKSHASDIGAKLICRGGQIAGVSSDVTDTKANDTDWEELSISFTPTEAGIVEIDVCGYWVANTADEYVTVEDMTITQA